MTAESTLHIKTIGGLSIELDSQWFLDYAEKAADYLLGSDQLKWLRRLETEHDNCWAGRLGEVERLTGETANLSTRKRHSTRMRH